ncbi:hypothetical protein DFH29DRAFT_875361 [Suillus ampliporus]|nr:hypothetical protein DFH29DRAFT_875361 [Suillus ampliporus]
MGDTVQAIIGGVYHQFAEGVPAEFHQKALALCERMSGVDMLVQEPVSNRTPSKLEAVETIQLNKAVLIVRGAKQDQLCDDQPESFAATTEVCRRDKPLIGD